MFLPRRRDNAVVEMARAENLQVANEEELRISGRPVKQAVRCAFRISNHSAARTYKITHRYTNARGNSIFCLEYQVEFDNLISRAKLIDRGSVPQPIVY